MQQHAQAYFSGSRLKLCHFFWTTLWPFVFYSSGPPKTFSLKVSFIATDGAVDETYFEEGKKTLPRQLHNINCYVRGTHIEHSTYRAVHESSVECERWEFFCHAIPWLWNILLTSYNTPPASLNFFVFSFPHSFHTKLLLQKLFRQNILSHFFSTNIDGISQTLSVRRHIGMMVW